MGTSDDYCMCVARVIMYSTYIFQMSSAVTAIAASAYSLRIAVGCENGKVHIWGGTEVYFIGIIYCALILVAVRRFYIT